jgi:hypothetical protein
MKLIEARSIRHDEDDEGTDACDTGLIVGCRPGLSGLLEDRIRVLTEVEVKYDGGTKIMAVRSTPSNCRAGPTIR